MMKKYSLFQTKLLLTILGISTLLFSCNKDEIVSEVGPYPPSTIGIAQAAVATKGPGANGIYSITAKIEGQVYRFKTDATAGKFILPMGVIRSGVEFGEGLSVNLSTNTDTIAKLIAAAKFPVGTEMLPSSAYTLPSNVNVENGSGNADFEIPIDLSFLVNNQTKKFAVGVSITSPKTTDINPLLSTAVIYIDPAQVLLPVANFSNAIDVASKTVAFTNLSANGTSYSWNFGDGSPAETAVSPGHKFSAAGTYIITLTTTGVTGTPSVKTTSINIL